MVKNASIYRFRESVALSLPGKGETIYLSAGEAQKIARALNKAARSVKTEPFAGNSVGTITVPLPHDLTTYRTC